MTLRNKTKSLLSFLAESRNLSILSERAAFTENRKRFLHFGRNDRGGYLPRAMILSIFAVATSAI
jgi:hypothetical protein